MTIKEIADKLKTVKSALIFSHNRPDGDTVGSATALCLALQSLGIKTALCCDSVVPKKFEVVKLADTYLKPEQVVDNYEVHIAVDCSVPSMFAGAYTLFTSNEKTFNVDHHISNSNYAKYNFVKETGACAESVYELIVDLGVKINKDIADCLLLGIVTDTGNFAHSNVTENTMLVASKLVGIGGDLHEIVYKMFKDQSKERASLYTRVLSKMRYYLDDQVGILTITKKDMTECNANDTMTEGFIDFPLTVRTVEVAISLLEVNDKTYKISFRSKGKVNVNEIASLYGGGGHVLASGAMINGYMEDIIDKLVYNCKQRL